MMRLEKKEGLYLFIFLLIGIAGFSFAGYLGLLKINRNLKREVKEAYTQLKAMEKFRDEAMRLRETKRDLQAKYEDVSQKFQQSQQELESVRSHLVEVTQKVETITKENLALKEQAQALEVRLQEVEEARKKLEFKFNCLAELKRAIHSLKGKMALDKRRRLKDLDAVKLKEGNRGYMVRGGRTTYRSPVRIEVLPAAPSSP